MEATRLRVEKATRALLGIEGGANHRYKVARAHRAGSFTLLVHHQQIPANVNDSLPTPAAQAGFAAGRFGQILLKN